jgi:hypothetical protein
VASSLQTKSIKWKQKVPHPPQSGNNEFSYITYIEYENIPLKVFYETVAKGMFSEMEEPLRVKTFWRDSGGSLLIQNLGNRPHKIYKSLLSES